jgi:predicted transcriptional regulator
MIEKTIQIFTDREEEFVSLLVRVGIRKTIAKTLVYLGRLKSATSREIEHGTYLRQPEVSVAMKYLAGRGWVGHEEAHPEGKGRPEKRWSLKMPVETILDVIGREKQDELKVQMEMIRKIRSLA